MSDSSGSILQLPSKAIALSTVNLLIVTANTGNFKAIAESLYAANIEFTYDLVDSIQSVKNCSQTKYHAVLYDLVLEDELQNFSSLQEKLQWWCHLFVDIPLILITDTLGDEQAVSLIQSGVEGYLIRDNLPKLPEILHKTLFDFISKKTIATQQQDLIKQQQEIIKRLESEKINWLKQDENQQNDIFEKQNEIKLKLAKIKQLEIEKRIWNKQEKIKKEHISHLNHELRSPISSILGFARMLKEKYYGPLNDKQMQYVGGILSSGEHLLALVNNYLDIVKIDANKQTLDLEKLAVGEICQAALFIVAEKAKQKKLDLSLNLAPDIDFCTADSVRLKQILINLLSNAIKFTEKGSITLQVKLEQEILHFAVIDTGMGISEKNLTKLFKPFPQITSHHESTGLGLTLSRKLAQLHGGDLAVTSQLGEGSCFTLSMPQHQ